MRFKYFIFLLFIGINTIAQNKSNSIGFKENKGQIIDQKGNPNNAVKYLLNTNGLNVQLKQNGFSYDIYETKKIPVKQHIEENNTFSSIAKNDKKIPDYNLEYTFHRIDIDFVNSNPNVELISNEESKDYDNYYNVPNKPEGIVNVHQYQQITYKNIYPNIDVVFSIPKDSLKPVEYNFVVHPNGKISDIQLKFNGAKTELVDNKIQMNVRFGEMEEILPASWTEDGNHKKEIAVTYKKIKKDVYGFNTLNSINGKTVIIDPVPVRLWGTYYGGLGEENNFNGIVKTNNQFVYIGGYTTSVTNISTSGSYQPNLALNDDAFIAKFDTEGQRIWSTYYGGSHVDIFRAIDFDSNNNIYAAGMTGSINNIATPDAHQITYNDWYDIMLIKFDINGQRIWGTYYGGEAVDQIRSIKVDHNQNILICGFTHSRNNITTANSFKPIVPPATNGNNQDSDGFVAKFSSNGQRIWATFYGGNDSHDSIESIDIDSNNNIFCSGTTTSFTGISTQGAYDETYNYNGMSWNDTFVVKFNTKGERLFGTYYGGTDYDINTNIKIDKENNFIITGYTRSKNGIGHTNSFQQNNGGNYDSYLAKFTNNGNLIWSTFYGGQGDDGAWGKNSVDIDENNSIYFFSSGTSNNNISTTGSSQENLKGYNNLYIAKFKPNGERIWGTYYGGKLSDYSGDISYDKNGVFYISGWTYSNTDIATPNAFQKNLNGTYDTFLIKFKDCELSALVSSNSPICIGNNLELKASGGTAYSWTGPNGFSSTEQNPIILNTTTLNSGQYSCLITGTGGCDDTKTVDVIVGDMQAPIPDLANLPTITGDCNTQTITIPTATDACAGIIAGITTSPLSYPLPGTYTIIWNYNDGNGNNSTQNQTVTITSQPLPTVNSPQTFCIQQNSTLNDIAINGQNIKWYDALTNGNLLANTSLLQNGITYYASQTINGCESARIPVLINIQNTLAPTGDTNQSFCSAQNATLNDIDITGTNIKWYNNSNIELPNTTLIGNNVTYYATQTVNTCESINKLTVTTTLINTLNANNYKVEFCDENNDGKETINLSDFNPNLISNPTDNSFLYYTSLVAAENQIANNRINYISNYLLPTGSYTVFVRIDSPNGCHQVVELGLNSYSKPVIPIDDIMPICEGSSITVNAGSGYDNYLWSTGETSPTITIQNPGNYSVTVMNNYDSISCSSTKDFTVKKSTIATINSIETTDWTDNQNIIKVFVSGEGDFEYSIDGIHFQDSNEFSNINSGQHTVQVRDKNGCGTVTNEVYLLMYPKFFTPNGDGYNDTWKIKFSDNEKNITIKIFDRYGKLLKELLTNASWNGQFNNQELPATDYWFIVTRADGKEYKGHFSLKR